MQKDNMMYLSKEATNKDQSLKMKLLLMTDDKAAVGMELIQKLGRLFGDQKGEFTINKPKFPESTLIYANQRSILTLEGGDHAIYLDYVVLGQLICAKHLSEDFDTYDCKPDEVKLYVLIYNNKTGEFKGIQNWLVYIRVRGDEDEMYLSHGYDEDKSGVLYSNVKQILPNIFQSTFFKKHNPMLLDQRALQEYSKLFFFLPSTTDRKEKINQFQKNVSL